MGTRVTGEYLGCHRDDRVKIYSPDLPLAFPNEFMVLIPKNWIRDGWDAAVKAREIMWSFSIAVGRDEEDFRCPPTDSYPNGIRVFNGEHDFDIMDVVGIGDKWGVFLEDLGS